MIQQAPQPQDGGGLILLQPDPLADQVCWLGDALGSVDEDEAVPKAAVQEDRDRFKPEILVLGGDVGRAGHFRDVKIPVAQEAPVARGRIHLRQDVQLNAVSLDRTILKGPGDLIISDGERQFQFFAHLFPLTSFD